jgi:Family of unknown function (DUF5677)
MSAKIALLPSLRALTIEQSALVTLALSIASNTSTEFEGKDLAFTLGDLQRRISTILAMAAGQSVNTVLKLTEVRGIGIRDAYPVARSAVESYINATYLLSEAEEVSQRALRHIPYAKWKHTNRIVGSGPLSLELQTQGNKASDAATLFPEFAAKGNNRNWTALDTPARIAKVGENAGRAAGSRLLASYALIYSLSSEVIHGSPFGVSHFYGLQGRRDPNLEDFLAGTEDQAEDILIAVMHAAAGYLNAFFGLQGHEAPARREADLFNRLVVVATSDESTTQPRKVHAFTPSAQRPRE